MQSIRTAGHSYPQAEIDAMTSFYSGKRCVISLAMRSVEWSCTLDPALHHDVQPYNERLSQMLQRNLRQDRHPRHAAEVRENVVPLRSDIHIAVGERSPCGTLFLHEDILARTLAYEQDLHRWRVAELEAGRGDPGRPIYEEVFGGIQFTQHRFHAANNFGSFSRDEGTDQVENLRIYSPNDCPGIDNPTSQNTFPVINTLLSIPFSLLHNVPRLTAMAPLSVYQQQVATMGLEIIRLWWWDPPLDLIETSEKIHQENAPNQRNSTRSTKPDPIYHQSRQHITFLMKQPIITYSAPTTCNSNQDGCTFQLPSGQILLGTIPSLSWDGGGPFLTAKHEDLEEMGDVQYTDKGIVSGAMKLPTMSEDFQTIEGTDNIGAMEGIEKKSPTGHSSLDILSWYGQVTESMPEPLPLTLGSFEKGVIGGMSTNDVLMIKGLIDPLVYIHFLDPSSFSHF